MKKEFTKMTGITEEMFRDYCEKNELNWKDKSVEVQFIKDVYDHKVRLENGGLKKCSMN